MQRRDEMRSGDCSWSGGLYRVIAIFSFVGPSLGAGMTRYFQDATTHALRRQPVEKIARGPERGEPARRRSKDEHAGSSPPTDIVNEGERDFSAIKKPPIQSTSLSVIHDSVVCFARAPSENGSSAARTR